ncbi:MAG: hypothetical protein KF693_03515 [Nitrospira sp.]|nr:hypothetical protein [Nitrospira sp.]
MRTIDLVETVTKAIKHLSKKGCGVEPYLFLTTKCEAPFRDRLAIEFHDVFKAESGRYQRYEATLEHTFNSGKKRKKVDIAVFERDQKNGRFSRPIGVVELKYVANPVRPQGNPQSP